ncbi:3-dehydroquinate synthase [Deinobacterium chartae]|uniref:3-dehydroquinate synthase n=1 Tax=Deinobacterium chartae TaxID=521158 RepID=A0A841I0R6_9DEIO|nr:3-dehydroquinate synthase family protein [Deinobacterium chartae]MBB6097702.1 3-dehydroquinate synthase [Deinobacterium chartae]
MIKLRVELEPAYDVTLGYGLLDGLQLPVSRVALLYDAALPAEVVERAARHAEFRVALPPGEACKTLEVYSRTLSELARHALPRDGAVLSLGGGATSDLAGFVAASYLRGVRLYSVPTTLLAVVDASVGGKTGVNLPEGKNLVGAFHQASAVTADLDTLRSLPERTFREGVSEMFKHDLLDPRARLGRFWERSDVGSPEFLEAVARSVAVKAGVVARDPHEAGERAYLNLGHTLGHALEAASRHALTHGEAVAYGLHYAAILSYLEGGADLTERTAKFLAWMRPGPLPRASFEDLAVLMNRDKKADSRGVRFTLLRDVGEAYLARVSPERQRVAFERFVTDVRAILGAKPER